MAPESTKPTLSTVFHYMTMLILAASLLVYAMMVKKEFQTSIAAIERKLMLADGGQCKVIAEHMYQKGKRIGGVSFENDSEMNVQHVLHLFRETFRKRTRRSLDGQMMLQVITILRQIMNNTKVQNTKHSGPSGRPGPPGRPGLPGRRGSPGPLGFHGLRGPQGPRGPIGPAGPKGKRGPRGSTGSKGDSGRIHYKAVKGEKGEPGPPGLPGAPGLPGPRGAKGERGRNGENGTSAAVPKISVALENQTIVAKRFAKFVCLASGYPVPEIQFHIYNRTMDERYERHGEGVLVIRNVRYEDEGDITCIAKSVLGEDLSTATLTVHVKAKAQMMNRTVETEEGYEIALRCIVAGVPHPTISWHKDGKELPGDAMFRDSNRVLFIDQATSNHSGKYVCSVSNYLQNSSAETKVHVTRRISFSFVSHASIQGIETEDIKIACIFWGGVGPFHISWFRNGQEIVPNSQFYMTGMYLLIYNVKIRDRGAYKCRVSSQLSTIESETILSVLPTSCKSIWKSGKTASGAYLIYPTKEYRRPARVECDMGRNGLTIVSHDSERKMMVDGYENPGQYRRKITYSIPWDLVMAIVKRASWCEQYIRYDCRDSVLRFGWWVSANGERMQNWGGVDHTRKGCACGLRRSCVGGGLCNCDRNDARWRYDSGILREKEYLPVSEVRFGDTGHSGEMGHHTVGKLACY